MTKHLRKVLLRRWGALVQSDLDRPGFWETVKVANGGPVTAELEREVRELCLVEAHKLFQRGWHT